jgi:hypothetical protein
MPGTTNTVTRTTLMKSVFKEQLNLEKHHAMIKPPDFAFNFYKDDVENGKIISLRDICSKFRESLVDNGVATATACRQHFIKSKIHSKFKNVVAFHSQAGNLLSIICAKSLSVTL